MIPNLTAHDSRTTLSAYLAITSNLSSGSSLVYSWWTTTEILTTDHFVCILNRRCSRARWYLDFHLNYNGIVCPVNGSKYCVNHRASHFIYTLSSSRWLHLPIPLTLCVSLRQMTSVTQSYTLLATQFLVNFVFNVIEDKITCFPRQLPTILVKAF